jgi:hypothetical protein
LVDESLLHFTWALPDLISLRRYLADKLGWDREKTDDMLVPKACAANNDPPPPFPSENFNIILHNRQITLKPKIQAAVARLKASCDGSIESHPELHRAKKRRKI